MLRNLVKQAKLSTAKDGGDWHEFGPPIIPASRSMTPILAKAPVRYLGFHGEFQRIAGRVRTRRTRRESPEALRGQVTAGASRQFTQSRRTSRVRALEEPAHHRPQRHRLHRLAQQMKPAFLHFAPALRC
jgi:hypothetical protein